MLPLEMTVLHKRLMQAHHQIMYECMLC
jgi:hypothetical protein